jgi:type VI protein secretion system component Hcp
VIQVTAPTNVAAQSRDHGSRDWPLAIQEEWQMNRDRDTAREIIVLTDAELDAVAGGFVKKVDKSSAKLFSACATGEHLKTA